MLGPLELDGTTSTLGLRDRVVLEALAVRPGTVVRAESLAEAIWGETPPPSWPKVVQGCVSRLRKALGGDVIETASALGRVRRCESASKHEDAKGSLPQRDCPVALR